MHGRSSDAQPPQLLTERALSCCVLGSYTVLQNSMCVFLQVAQIVKHEMENAVKLSVKLNVKVKIGPSWGELQDLEL